MFYLKHPITFGTPHSACFDIACAETVFLRPNTPTVVPTGFVLDDDFPVDAALFLFSRSGMATKGVTVLNSPGIVDADYRGPVGVILNWNGYVPLTQGHSETLEIAKGTRVAQAMIMCLSDYQLVLREHENTTILSESRGSGGYGSTGS